MSDTSVIKEFLVALGFQVDDAKFKKFEEGIGRATKTVQKLAAEVVVAEEAVVAAVVTMSARFEDLYYASQRMRSTVENIRATGYAISQMGGDAKGGLAALEGLASFMRSNPGGERFIASLGVSTRDAKGELRDTAEILRDLGGRFAQMPYYIAKVRAGLLGIDEKTLQALIRGTDDWAAHYHAMAQRVGVDQQAAAQKTHDFMTRVRDLGAYLELLADKYLLPLLSPLERVIDLFKRLDQASGGLSTALVVVMAILAPIFALFGSAGLIAVGVAALADAIVLLWDDFSTWREGGKSLIDWKTWSWEIDQAQGAIGQLIGAIGRLLSIVPEIGHELADVFGPTLTGAMRIVLRLMIDMVKTVGDLADVVDDFLHRRFGKAWNDLGRAAHEGNGLFGDHTGEGPSAQQRGAAQQAYAAAQNSASAVASIAGPVARALTSQRMAFATGYLQSQGIRADIARAIVAGSFAESRFDPNAVNPKSGAFGIGQWLGDRKNTLFAQFGRNPSFDQQLQFLVQELKGGDRGGASVLGAGSAQAALTAYITRFMRPADGGETGGDMARGLAALAAMGGSPSAPLANPGAYAAAAGPGGVGSANGPSVVQTNKTDIHVYGSGDPRQTAQDTLAGQERINGNLLRNLQTVVQ